VTQWRAGCCELRKISFPPSFLPFLLPSFLPCACAPTDPPTAPPFPPIGNHHDTATTTPQGAQRPFNVVVTSYEGVLKERCALEKIQWRYIIIDEVGERASEQEMGSKQSSR
jgi:hypothetical protein